MFAHPTLESDGVDWYSGLYEMLLAELFRAARVMMFIKEKVDFTFTRDATKEWLGVYKTVNTVTRNQILQWHVRHTPNRQKDCNRSYPVG